MQSIINYSHTDNMEYMAHIPDNYYDWVIADPEWGRGEDGGKNRYGIIVQKNGRKDKVGKSYAKKYWDDKPASKAYLDEAMRVSKNQIVWGVNYLDYDFPAAGRIVWDKVNDGTDQSDCEIAYNSSTNRVDLFRFMWRGMMQGKSIRQGHIQRGNKKLNQKKFHPTQKPIELYLWMLQKFVVKNSKILDPNLGSGSIGIATHIRGELYLDACENDVDYFGGASDWLCEARKQDKAKMFI